VVLGGLSVASIAISTAAMLKKFVAKIVVDEKYLVLKYEGLWPGEGNS